MTRIERHRGWRLSPIGASLVAALAVVGGAASPGQDRGPAPERITVPVQVRDPEPGHPNVVSKKEHCAVAPRLLAEVGATVGQQVRITRSDSEFAIFTVVATLDESPPGSVAVSKLGRGRIGSTEVFDGRLSASLPRSELTDDEAKTRGELVERLDDDGQNTGLLVMAPHGGQLEPPTDLQAERVAQQIGGNRVSTWRCRGYQTPGGKSAFERWHITSTDISPVSYPLLGRVATRRFAYSVSFHGMVEDRVVIGGSGPSQLKVEIRDAIREALAATNIKVDIALPGDANGGKDPKNIVNRYADAGGVQIEQSLRARRDHWKEIADAVAQIYANKL